MNVKVIAMIGLLIVLFHFSSMAIHEEMENVNLFDESVRRTLYVGGSGPGNYSKIQDAIDNASDRDTVFVYEGIYYENIVINRSINLIGENAKTTIIDGMEKGNVIYVCGNRVCISNFTIQHGGGAWPGAGIFIYSSDNVISNNIIRNNGKGIILVDLVSKRNKVYKNTVVSNAETGIDIFNAEKNIIKENNVLHNGGDGIEIADAGSNTIEKNVLADTIYLGRAYGNIVKDNSFSEGGIRIWHSFGNKLLNNTIKGEPIVYLEDKRDLEIDKGAQVILVRCEGITIKNLNISNTCCAIHLSFCNGCTVEENVLENNSFGIEMYSCKRNLLKRNTLKNNECGILLEMHSNMNKIFDNNFVENNVHAIFSISFYNLWLRNYWDNWKLPLPKPVFGFIYGFPWLNFDWMPRSSPQSH
ncbi:MAG: hypothetical protein DRN00_02880 [Thermoplasmata archaeon]|nr:MAG: hypothetical protein DRN00_02880 [Thermoplasmata archaeon]